MSDLPAQDEYCPLCNGTGRVTKEKGSSWLGEHDRLILAINKAERASDILAVPAATLRKMTTDQLIARMRAAMKHLSGTASW